MKITRSIQVLDLRGKPVASPRPPRLGEEVIVTLKVSSGRTSTIALLALLLGSSSAVTASALATLRQQQDEPTPIKGITEDAGATLTHKEVICDLRDAGYTPNGAHQIIYLEDNQVAHVKLESLVVCNLLLLEPRPVRSVLWRYLAAVAQQLLGGCSAPPRRRRR